MSHVKTWQERAKDADDFPVYCADTAATYMKLEIADLRAALEAQATAPVANDGYCAPSSTGECSCRKFGADPSECSNSPGMQDIVAANAPFVIDDRLIADTVNQLRDIAVEFHGAQQLRERIAHVIVPLLKSVPVEFSPDVLNAGDDAYCASGYEDNDLRIWADVYKAMESAIRREKANK